jgi:2-phosphosulfolactate phosphatase
MPIIFIMLFHRAILADCSQVTGLAVVIDVLRAFTTAGYLFAAGVSQIILVSGVDEAFDLRERIPGSLILGEIDGIQVQGFNLGNSPSELSNQELSGKTIIQRTTAGTQGVVRAVNAQPILTAALTNAAATARYIEQLDPPQVTFILTGLLPDQDPGGKGKDWGDEDAVCADLIEAYLINRTLDAESIAARVRGSRSGLHYDGTRLAFPPADLDLALDIDRFPFAMLVEKQDGLHYMQAVPIPPFPASREKRG